jgi:quinol monooxygenase YgiN
MYKVWIKENKVATFQRLADETLIPEALKISGCKLFSLYQNSSNKNEFIFHEIWDAEESVHRYKQTLFPNWADHT